MRFYLMVLSFVCTLLACDGAGDGEPSTSKQESEHCTALNEKECVLRQIEKSRNDPVQVAARTTAQKSDLDHDLLKQCQRADFMLKEVSNLEECERQRAELRRERAAKNRVEDSANQAGEVVANKAQARRKSRR